MSHPIPDQGPIWEAKHARNVHESLRDTPSPFAEIASVYFNPASYILELGCGVGRDAIYFAELGHTIVATDFSPSVIRSNTDRNVHNKCS